MVVQKNLDIASPHLWVATVTGQLFKTIRIQVMTPGGGGTPYVLYDILLTNAEITSIDDSASSAFPQESLALKATSVTMTFNSQNPTTGVITGTTTSFAC
jgi:type VI protein secretion system component Hcp